MIAPQGSFEFTNSYSQIYEFEIGVPRQEIFMSHVMEVYVTTCHMSRRNQVSQLKLLLIKLFSYSDSNLQKYQLINQQY